MNCATVDADMQAFLLQSTPDKAWVSGLRVAGHLGSSETSPCHRAECTRELIHTMIPSQSPRYIQDQSYRKTVVEYKSETTKATKARRNETATGGTGGIDHASSHLWC